MAEIIGRKQEKVLLQQVFDASRAEFLALYGRRRVGKTFLIKNFFDKRPNTLFFYCSGLQKWKLAEQLNEFSTQSGRTFYDNAPLKARNNWMDAFLDLSQAVALSPLYMPKK